MGQNIFAGIFDVESEGYQAFSELKQNPGEEKSVLSQVALVTKKDGAIRVLDSFDTGATSVDDMAIGGAIGAVVGILGGPIGVLLGSSYGVLLGSVVDAGDALGEATMLEQVAGKMQEGDTVLIGMANEEDESILDEKLSKFQVTLLRFDASRVADEVAEASEMELEMARQARAELHKEKSEELKKRIAERRESLKKHFEEVF